ncbi:PaaI family thioesterase [Sulfurimonas autotrophica]|uniref:Thioesterase superfamily protein n=1 Tax=Sulfurimonas autotrophica (strain ATCC BAA-671 / DSM 16294 / JCM 11897 / OK10) TaxID=563040 RepID=E0URJ6_SULAO|nr:PaaI family thioesterase [Sulfurimonas autotrophica]ADN08940.1 thioesterase superfamily protein [Sulfurimonas autotrophica DSM 16294]
MENEQAEDDLELDEYQNPENQVMIKTHERINQNLCGEIVKMEEGYVELSLTTIPDMLADDVGLIHGGFIFGAADYAAMLAVNERNVVLVASDCQFLSPVKLHDVVDVVARLRHKEGRKRNVHVQAFVLDIKVFEGEFKTVITEKHILKLKLLEDEEKMSGTQNSQRQKS